MRPQIALGALDWNSLFLVIESFSLRLKYAYLESETDISLCTFAEFMAPGGEKRRERWTHGRVFGPTLEIRWRNEDLLVEAELLAEEDLVPPGWTNCPWNDRLDPDVEQCTILMNRSDSHRMAGIISIAPLRLPEVSVRCVRYALKGKTIVTRLCDLVQEPTAT